MERARDLLLVVLACERVSAMGKRKRGRVGRWRRRPLRTSKPKTRGRWKVLDLITDNTGPLCVSLRLRASWGLVFNSTGPILKLL